MKKTGYEKISYLIFFVLQLLRFNAPEQNCISISKNFKKYWF